MASAESIQRLFVRDEPRPSDAILVFGCDKLPLSRARVEHACDLYMQGIAPRILLSGGVTGGREMSEAAWMRQVAVARGIPESALVLETDSRTTVENLRCTRQLLVRDGALATTRRLVLVSCPWHMRRCQELARRLMPSAMEFVCSPHAACCPADVAEFCDACRAHIHLETQIVARLLGTTSST